MARAERPQPPTKWIHSRGGGPRCGLWRAAAEEFAGEGQEARPQEAAVSGKNRVRGGQRGRRR